MLLKEILSEIDLLVPNSVPMASKISFINQIQSELFRDFRLKTGSFFFYTVPGTELYDLPCQPDNLLEVYIDGKEYHQKDKDHHNHGRLFMIAGGKLLIQPTPTTKEAAYLYYYAAPTNLTAADMDKSPDLATDYHEILTLGAARKVAFIMKQYDIYKVLDDQYTRMVQQGIIKMAPRQQKVRVTRGWI